MTRVRGLGAAFALRALFPTTTASTAKHIVTVAPQNTVVLAAGSSRDLRIGVSVAEGFHLHANPASEEYLIPTKLDLPASSGVQPGEPVYPPGRSYRLQGASSDLSIYEGRFEIRVPLRASTGAEAGDRTLVGTLHYQACDARRCFSPSSIGLEVRVRITPP